MCVYVIRLWKCVVSIIISHTKNITDVTINNSIINNATKFIIYMHSFVIIHNNLDTRIFIANQAMAANRRQSISNKTVRKVRV